MIVMEHLLLELTAKKLKGSIGTSVGNNSGLKPGGSGSSGQGSAELRGSRKIARLPLLIASQRLQIHWPRIEASRAGP